MVMLKTTGFPKVSSTKLCWVGWTNPDFINSRLGKRFNCAETGVPSFKFEFAF
jgi:hypothetical protein